MKPPVSLLVATLLLTLAGAAQARMALDEATMPTIGCSSADDLADVLKAGRVTGKDNFGAAHRRVDAIEEKKISENRCFKILPGQEAVTSPDLQFPEKLSRGLSVLLTADRAPFWSPSWTWRYLGEVP